MKGPKNGVVKASFCSSVVGDNARFKKSSVVLILSMGQETAEWEKLAAQLELINNNFKECIVVLADTLQRYTLKVTEKLKYSEVYDVALQRGKLWLKRNQTVLSKLTIPHKITTWNDWLEHPNYQENRKLIDCHFENSPSFKQAFLNTAELFYSRYQTRIGTVSSVSKREEDISYCLEYLKEESTIIMPIWAKEGINFIIYPSEIPEALQAAYECLVKPKYGDTVARWIPVKFKRYAAQKTSNLYQNNKMQGQVLSKGSNQHMNANFG